MSTKKETPEITDTRAHFFTANVPASHPVVQALETVQNKLDKEKESRKEERFYWICCAVLIVNIFTFQKMDSWSAPLSITFLEFIVLVSLGRRLGVDHIWTLTEKIISKWNGNLSGKE